MPMTNNKGFRSAYGRGFEAGYKGQSNDRCPYPDLRTYRGAVTFSRAWRRYWKHGWEDGKKAREADRQAQEQVKDE